MHPTIVVVYHSSLHSFKFLLVAGRHLNYCSHQSPFATHTSQDAFLYLHLGRSCLGFFSFTCPPSRCQCSGHDKRRWSRCAIRHSRCRPARQEARSRAEEERPCPAEATHLSQETRSFSGEAAAETMIRETAELEPIMKPRTDASLKQKSGS